MRKIMLAGLAAIAMVAPQAQAREELAETGPYDYSVGLRTQPGVTFGYADPANRIGGYIFGAPGYEPTRVVVIDDNSASIGITVAQDFDADGLSGEAGEPSVVGCGGSLSVAGSTVKFDPARQIAVFTRLFDSTCPAGSLGTSGSIELYVEIPDEEL